MARKSLAYKLGHFTGEVLQAFDRLANAILLGYAEETLSARIWRAELNGSRTARVLRILVDTAFFWHYHHCKSSFYKEIFRQQLSPSYREKNMVKDEDDVEIPFQVRQALRSIYTGPERRAEMQITEEQLETVAKRAAEIAMEQLTQRIYAEIGKAFVQRFLVVVGMLVVGGYFGGKAVGWWR